MGGLCVFAGGLQLATLTTAQIQNRVRILEGNVRALTAESTRLDHDKKVQEMRLKENMEKVKLNKQLPYLISNVVEVCGAACAGARSPWTLRDADVRLLEGRPWRRAAHCRGRGGVGSGAPAPARWPSRAAGDKTLHPFPACTCDPKLAPFGVYS
jgi:hypothetical protein